MGEEGEGKGQCGAPCELLSRLFPSREVTDQQHPGWDGLGMYNPDTVNRLV